MKVKIQSKDGLKIVNLNRRKAIREMCLNCSGWISKEVTNCAIAVCSLFPFRSGKEKQNAKERSKAIRNYCLWCMNGSRSEVSKCPSSDCSLFPYRKSTVDRSAKIKTMPKKGHIEPVSEDKMKNEYLIIRQA